MSDLHTNDAILRGERRGHLLHDLTLLQLLDFITVELLGLPHHCIVARHLPLLGCEVWLSVWMHHGRCMARRVRYMRCMRSWCEGRPRGGIARRTCRIGWRHIPHRRSRRPRRLCAALVLRLCAEGPARGVIRAPGLLDVVHIWRQLRLPVCCSQRGCRPRRCRRCCRCRGRTPPPLAAAASTLSGGHHGGSGRSSCGSSVGSCGCRGLFFLLGLSSSISAVLDLFGLLWVLWILLATTFSCGTFGHLC